MEFRHFLRESVSHLVKLVGMADAKGQKYVKVRGVRLVGAHHGTNCHGVIIIFCVHVPQKLPCLCAVTMFLDLHSGTEAVLSESWNHH